MYELSKQFRFEAAHTLQRVIDAEPSRRIYGHSYRAEVFLRGEPDPQSGMLMDLGLFVRLIERVRDGLDHRFLDEVEGLGAATLENLRLDLAPSRSRMPGDGAGDGVSRQRGRYVQLFRAGLKGAFR